MASEDWADNSTDAIQISLVRADGDSIKTLSTFSPKFTYSIFGDEEAIFGYKDLKIALQYHACDMRPNLHISYTKKFQAVGDTEPTDIKGAFEDFLPKTAFEKQNVFKTAISDPSSADWTPPGKLLKTITAGDKTYEVWAGNLLDPAVLQMVKRLQILVSFYIEGGTPIQLDDAEWSLKRWSIFFLYEKSTVYTFMGYATVYQYYHYHHDAHSQSLDLPLPESAEESRTRISQFIILPPFQGGGHGARFYNTIFDHFLEDPYTVEVTVEDPNEAFDDLRDLNDLLRLRKDPEFSKIQINTKAKIDKKAKLPTAEIIDKEALEKLRVSSKIAPRQFYRVVEMQLLSLIPLSIRQSLIVEKKVGDPAELKKKEREYYLWNLLTKQRLYKHNREQLAQMDRAERIDCLEQTVGGVEADYARLLRKLEGSSGGSKRAAEDEAEPISKRARVE